MLYKIGDHLVTPRLGYTHHGVYVGNGRVVHYSGLADGWKSGDICLATLKEFSSGKKILVKNHSDRAHLRRKTVRRAFMRLGENKYNIAWNNCEHFASWCISGNHASEQVDDALMALLFVASNLGAGGVASALGRTALALGGKAFRGKISALISVSPKPIRYLVNNLNGVAAINNNFAKKHFLDGVRRPFKLTRKIVVAKNLIDRQFGGKRKLSEELSEKKFYFN